MFMDMTKSLGTAISPVARIAQRWRIPLVTSITEGKISSFIVSLTKLEGDFRDDIIVDTLKNGIWLDNSNLVFSLSISSGPQVFNETIQKLVGVVIGEVLFDLLRVCLDLGCWITPVTA